MTLYMTIGLFLRKFGREFKLSATERCVLSMLALRLGAKSEWRISLETFISDTGLSKRALINSLQILKEKELIFIERWGRENKYSINLEKVQNMHHLFKNDTDDNGSENNQQVHDMHQLNLSQDDEKVHDMHLFKENRCTICTNIVHDMHLLTINDTLISSVNTESISDFDSSLNNNKETNKEENNIIDTNSPLPRHPIKKFSGGSDNFGLSESSKKPKLKKAKKKFTDPPPDFVITKDHHTRFEKLNLQRFFENVEEVWDECKEWHLSKGEQKADWSATFLRWLKRTKEYKENPYRGKNYVKRETASERCFRVATEGLQPHASGIFETTSNLLTEMGSEFPK